MIFKILKISQQQWQIGTQCTDKALTQIGTWLISIYINPFNNLEHLMQTFKV